MSKLNDARQAVGAHLTPLGDWTVYTYVPERITAPAAIVSPGDPFLDSDGVPFGSFTARWRVTLVADVATNEVVTEQLDSMIEDALIELSNAGLAVESVSEPYVFQSNENMHLAADMAASEAITF